MKRVFICSRYRGDISRNTATAEKLCRMAVEQGCAPFAPHLLYPRFLDDSVAPERKAGISCGEAFMEVCDEVWAYVGDSISQGMWQEILHARRLGKPVVEVLEL